MGLIGRDPFFQVSTVKEAGGNEADQGLRNEKSSREAAFFIDAGKVKVSRGLRSSDPRQKQCLQQSELH